MGMVAASYGVLYVLSIVIGVARGNQNFAYLAGYYLPVTSVAIALGVWRAPKWRANNLMAMASCDREEPVVKTVDTER